MHVSAPRIIGRIRNSTLATQFALGLLLLFSTSAALHAQQAATNNPNIFVRKPVTYNEKFDVYGGIFFANGQAGQNLPKRFNLAGGEGQLTYWLNKKWGVSGDARWMGGTTPVLPQAQAFNIQTRPAVFEYSGMGGVQYRWIGNQKIAVQFHAMAGVLTGIFDHSTNGQDPLTTTGMYRNGSTPTGVAGGSIDFNVTHKWAVRVVPEITFEHFGTETREFVAVSGGAVYRFH